MMNKYIFFLIMALVAIPGRAQQWVVPNESSVRLSPFSFSDSTRKAGNELYNLNCKSCHGDPGKHNVINLVPAPPDPASAKMQDNPDGALQFKISQGRAPMPSFKNILSAADIWYVISYIRSFNNKYVQKIESKPKGSVVTVENAGIAFTWIKEKNQVQVMVSSGHGKLLQPVSGAEVKLFAKRYFGNLPVDQARVSDNQGKAFFNFPKDLPGDSAGRIQLVAQFSGPASFGDVKGDTILAIGVPTYLPPLNEQRAMWNVVRKAPIWLLMTYTISVLTAWGFIIYVLVQIGAISRAGIKKD